jgi:hypothetical protein
MFLLSQGWCFIQSLLFSYVLREDSVKFSRIYFGSLSAIRTTWYSVRTLISQQHPSGQRDLSVRTTRSFHPDAHQCLEAWNSSRLHPSGRNGKSSGRSSEFEKIPVFQRIRLDDVVIPSGRHSVFDKKWGFYLKTQLWEDGCYRPDDV